MLHFSYFSRDKKPIEPIEQFNGILIELGSIDLKDLKGWQPDTPLRLMCICATFHLVACRQLSVALHRDLLRFPPDWPYPVTLNPNTTVLVVM